MSWVFDGIGTAMSGIMYFKPNESLEYWQKYSPSEIDELHDWGSEHCFK